MRGHFLGRHVTLLAAWIAISLPVLWGCTFLEEVDVAESARDGITTEDADEIVSSDSRIDRPDPPVDRHAQSEFRSSDLVKNEYLVVTVVVTRESMTRKGGAILIRAPTKPSSRIDDLRVRSLTELGKLIEEYAIADPRFRRRQSESGRQPVHERFIVESAEQRIYVPLSARVAVVDIAPTPGRESVVSRGGSFDPGPLAAAACAKLADGDGDRFPSCDEFRDPPDPPDPPDTYDSVVQ